MLPEKTHQAPLMLVAAGLGTDGDEKAEHPGASCDGVEMGETTNRFWNDEAWVLKHRRGWDHTRR